MDASEKSYSKLHPKRVVAAACLVNDAEEILLVRTHNLPNKWQPVAGGVEEGESPEQAIEREIKEELTVEADVSRSIFNTSKPYDFGEGTVYFYTIPISPSVVASFSIDASEIKEIKWFTLNDALRCPSYPATAHYINEYFEWKQRSAEMASCSVELLGKHGTSEHKP